MIVFLFVSQSLYTQQTRNRLDNRGKKFFVAFLHIHGAGNGSGNPRDEYFSQFAISISCEKPTKGKLKYLFSNTSVDITIPQANKSVRFNLDTFKLLLPNPFEEPISNKTLLVEFDDEVTLQAINTMRWSSDAFLALPVEVLGNDNYVLSYPSTISTDPRNDRLNIADWRSQFAVIGSEDSTKVTIIPSTEINGIRNSFVINLNAGEIFFAKAGSLALALAGTDVSGTRVISDKPVVVYGSHQRTNIPFNQSSGRDHLVEQMIPVKHWALGSIATPFNQVPKSSPDQDFMRIIASEDSTLIALDSIPVRIINKGEIGVVPLNNTEIITTNKPVMIAQYHNSSVDEKEIRIETDTLGDPFYTLTFAREQFDSIYTFNSFSSVEFREHYINIAIPTERIKTIVLDGSSVNESSFKRIKKTSYSYAQIKVNSGSHHIHAASPFALQIYGYGGYNSYGYPGGIVLDTIFKDHTPPLINFVDSCLSLIGNGLDSTFNDFGIESISLLPESQNVKINVPKFKKGEKNVPFYIGLTNPYEDGLAIVKVVDTAGLDNQLSKKVKGFTLGFDKEPIKYKYDTLASLSGLKFCRTIIIKNYGAFDQTLTKINFQNINNELSINAALPVTLKPNEDFKFEICYQHIGDTSFIAELSIGNDCIVRPIIEIPIYSALDTLNPKLSINPDPCKISPELVIGEFYAINSGISEIKFLELSNANVELMPNRFPEKLIIVKFVRKNIREDIIYKVVVKDLVGNTTFYSDTIGGFTISSTTLSNKLVGSDNVVPFNFKEGIVGLKQCDTIIFKNYGLKTVSISNLRLKFNVDFSIPPIQYPILLNPGESINLVLCSAPMGKGLYTDTVLIDFACGGFQDRIPLNVNLLAFNSNSKDNCGNEINVSIGGFIKEDFLMTPTPNPTIGDISVFLGLKEDNLISINITDLSSNYIHQMESSAYFRAGINKIKIDLSKYDSGNYLLSFILKDKLLIQKITIKK